MCSNKQRICVGSGADSSCLRLHLTPSCVPAVLSVVAMNCLGLPCPFNVTCSIQRLAVKSEDANVYTKLLHSHVYPTSGRSWSRVPTLFRTTGAHASPPLDEDRTGHSHHGVRTPAQGATAMMTSNHADE